MKRKLHLLSMFILSVTLLSAGFISNVHALGDLNISPKIPVSVSVKGENAPSITTTVTLKAVNHAPLPSDNSLTFNNIKEETKTFGSINFTKPGDYQYIISQTAENKPYFTLDKRVYIVTIRVMNDGKGGFVYQYFGHNQNDPNEKSDKFIFTHTYKPPFIPNTPPSSPKINTGDSSHIYGWFLLAISALYIIYQLHSGHKKKSCC